MAVFAFGLLTMWAQGRSLTGDGNGWLLVSVLVFLSMIPLVPLIFLPRGRVFEAALEAARAKGTVTPELIAAFGDPMVAFARIYEAVVVAVVVALMVVKPF